MPQPYTGEALKTYERIHVLRAYHYNKLYISPEKIIYHVNRHGFLHAYTAGKCKDYDGSKIYYIRDNLLTRENLLKESLTTFYHSKEEAKAAWEAMQADAEANTAEEHPQEAATDTGTTAGGESITTTETEPQRATERPQADAEPHHPANDQERQDAHKTTGRPQQTATDREESSPQKAATDQEPQEAPTAAENTTCRQTTTRKDKEPQEATQRHQEAPTSAGTNADTETPTNGETAPQEATSEATTAPDQDNTNSTPEAAQEANQEPGHAAGDHTGPAADHITGPGTAAGDYTGPTTGNTSGAAAEAITGRTTTTPQNPGHACENAPGRTERATAEQVQTPHAKRPPRAAQRATTHGRPRGHPEKTANFGRFYPLLDFPRTIFANFQGVPISVCIFGPVFDPEFWSPKQDSPGGYQNLLQSPAKKFSKNIFRWR